MTGERGPSQIINHHYSIYIVRLIVLSISKDVSLNNFKNWFKFLVGLIVDYCGLIRIEIHRHVYVLPWKENVKQTLCAYAFQLDAEYTIYG